MQNEFDDKNQPGNFSNQANSSDYNDLPGLFARRGRYRRSAASRVFFAVFLIAAGTLLFLGNVGILPIHDVWAYWPLILVALGIARLFGCRSAAGLITGIFLIVFGALFLLISLGILQVNTHDNSWPIALLMIAFGFLALAKTLEQTHGPKPRIGFPNDTSVLLDNALNERVVFGGVKRRVETNDFAGGTIYCVFGGVELDLRRAQIPLPGNQAVINIHCIFGAVKIRVPETWRVSIQGVGVFGTYEDKTIPSRPSDALDAPSLIITGNSVFSAVEIEN